MRQIFLILVIYCVGFALPVPELLGPNVKYGALGAAAPANFRGGFVPQANLNFDFSWIEPLGADPYGTWMPNKTNYIRFFAGAEASPFYGTLKAGLGFAILPPPFAVFELRMLYSNETLLWSNVEMRRAWNAGYILDRLYDNSSHAQIQSFDVQIMGRYASLKLDVLFLFSFGLVDVLSDYDQKSFDYMRGIPLYSRDYILSEEFSAVYCFGESFYWNADFLVLFSGRQFKLYSPFKPTDKEPLSYFLASTGPLWKFNNGKSLLSVNPGLFMQGDDSKVFRGSVMDRIILSVKYKHFWNFNFGK